MHRLACALALVVVLSGCKGEPSTGAPEGGAPATPAAAEADLEGTLRFRELPQAQSVQAYDGVEFFLTDAAGAEHALEPSDAVPRDALRAQDGKRVKVHGVWRAPPVPEGGAAPIGPDGEPIPPRGRHRVSVLTPG